MIAAARGWRQAVQCYYSPIINNGQLQADEVGELFASAELAIQYGARVARDIANDPEHDRAAGTVIIVVDASGAEITRHRVERRAEAGDEGEAQ